MSFRKFPQAMLCGCVVLFVCTGVFAQSPSGEFNGSVTGPDGAGLPGALISIRNQDTGETTRLAAGKRGIYRARSLSPGKYEIRAENEGFYPASQANLDLGAGEARRVDFALTAAALREIVTVVASTPRESLEASEIRESSARDVGEALVRISGVSKLRKGGIANDMVLRGFQSKDLNTLIDGQRIDGACPNHMDPAVFHVDFAEVDRIEIGKGPFDIRNQGSLGGIVNIITRKPAPGFHASGNLSAGSYGYVNPSVTASYANNRISVLGGYSYRISDPYTDGSGKRFTEYGNYRSSAIDSDAFRIGTAWGKWSFAPRPKQMIQLSYSRQGADHVLYPYLLMDAIYDNADRVNFGYQWNDPSGVVKSVKFQGYFTQVHHWMTDVFRTSSTGMAREYSMGTLAKTQVEGGKVETSFRTLTLGVEGFRRFWRTTTQMAGMGYLSQASIPDVEVMATGIYGDYKQSISDRLKITLGGRIDRTRAAADPSMANTDLYYAYHGIRSTSATDIFSSGNARIAYSTRSGVEFSAGIGHTVRLPDAVERYYALRRSGTDWVGNPALQPSRNTGVDGSVSYRYKGLYLHSSLYLNAVHDYITVINKARASALPGVLNPNARSYENIEARISGGELLLVYSITRRLFLTSTSAYVRGAQDPIASKGIYSRYLAEMPPINSHNSLRFDTGRLFAEISGEFAAPQRRVDTDLREQPTPGFGIANLAAGTHIKGMELRIVLNNVFGKKYLESLSFQRDPFRSGTRVYEPGRNLYISLSWRR